MAIRNSTRRGGNPPRTHPRPNPFRKEILAICARLALVQGTSIAAESAIVSVKESVLDQLARLVIRRDEANNRQRLANIAGTALTAQLALQNQSCEIGHQIQRLAVLAARFGTEAS